MFDQEMYGGCDGVCDREAKDKEVSDGKSEN